MLRMVSFDYLFLLFKSVPCCAMLCYSLSSILSTAFRQQRPSDQLHSDLPPSSLRYYLTLETPKFLHPRVPIQSICLPPVYAVTSFPSALVTKVGIGDQTPGTDPCIRSSKTRVAQVKDSKSPQRRDCTQKRNLLHLKLNLLLDP